MVLRPDAVRERLLKLEEVISHLEEVTRLDPATMRLNFRDGGSAHGGGERLTQLCQHS